MSPHARLDVERAPQTHVPLERRLPVRVRIYRDPRILHLSLHLHVGGDGGRSSTRRQTLSGISCPKLDAH